MHKTPHVSFSSFQIPYSLAQLEKLINRTLKSRRRQAQGFKIAKEKGVYQGRPILYGPDARDPQKQAVYYQIVQMLDSGLPIKKIAEKNGVTRPTVYRIQNELQKES